jgi:hypothetical protein
MTSPSGIHHHLCVVAKTPVAASHYEWVARASCRSAFGQESDTAKTIIDDIYDTLPENASVRDSWENVWTTKLNYAFPLPDPGGSIVGDLLDNAKGKCGHWSVYLLALCNVQGYGEAHGLKRGLFRIHMADSVPWWYNFRIEHNGINNGDLPNTPQKVFIVKKGEYPLPTYPGDFVYTYKKWWWAAGTAYVDHEIVFLDLDGQDWLYDPSFPGAQPKPVPWPGASGAKPYDRSDSFLSEYFIASCPYLYGEIVREDGVQRPYHIHTEDFDRGDPGNVQLKFSWTARGGHWE